MLPEIAIIFGERNVLPIVTFNNSSIRILYEDVLEDRCSRQTGVENALKKDLDVVLDAVSIQGHDDLEEAAERRDCEGQGHYV
jgi:hypothetical protein